MKLKLLLFLCCLSFVGLNAQTTETLIQNYLERTHESLGVTLEDVQNIKIVSDYETQKTGLQHVVVQQTVNEIPVFNAVCTASGKSPPPSAFCSFIKPKVLSKLEVKSDFLTT